MNRHSAKCVPQTHENESTAAKIIKTKSSCCTIQTSMKIDATFQLTNELFHTNKCHMTEMSLKGNVMRLVSTFIF